MLALVVRRVQALKDEIKRLKAQLQQRDNEIAILVNMVKTAKSNAAAQVMLASAPTALLPPTPHTPGGVGGTGVGHMYQPPGTGTGPQPLPTSMHMAMSVPGPGTSGGMSRLPTPTAGPSSSVGVMLANGAVIGDDILRDREKAFDAFRAAYPKNEVSQYPASVCMRACVGMLLHLGDVVLNAGNGGKQARAAREVRRRESNGRARESSSRRN